MHHALVDGMAAVDVSTVILDPTPEGLDIEPPPAEPATPRGRAARLEGLTRLASAQLALPRYLAREAVARSIDPRTYAARPAARRAWWASWRACAPRRRPPG